MSIEYRKVRSPTPEQVVELGAAGWSCVGPMPSDPDLMRFSRRVGCGAQTDDVTLDPQGIRSRLNVKIR